MTFLSLVRGLKIWHSYISPCAYIILLTTLYHLVIRPRIVLTLEYCPHTVTGSDQSHLYFVYTRTQRPHQFILLSASINHTIEPHGPPWPGALISAQIPTDTEQVYYCSSETPSGSESIRQFTASLPALHSHSRRISLKHVRLFQRGNVVQRQSSALSQPAHQERFNLF